VINQPLVEDIDNIIKYGITVGTCYDEFVSKLDKKAKEKGLEAKIHIEIESGMGRTGVQEKNLEHFIEKIKKMNNIIVEGIYTHFAESDTNIEYTQEQINKFKKAVDIVKQNFDTIKYVHCANSGAILNIDNYPGNMVRPGIMLYGYYPDLKLKDKIKLKPAYTLKTKISFMKEVEKGTPIGYGRTYVTSKKTKIANIPIGYADGIKRAMSNNGSVVINGKKAPIVGTICMDSFMVDVTEIEDVNIGNEVYIWDNKIITVDDVAKKCKTINYEILCTISNRVIRKASC
jgi:alanine racemase